MAEDALVVFTPSGRRGRFPLGTPLLEAGRALGVDIDSVCGGRGLCGRCQIEVGEGAFAKHGITSTAAHLSPLTAPEALYDRRRGLKPGRRLSCHALVQGDVVVDVPPESQIHRQIVRKRAEARAIVLDPVLRLHYVEVSPASLDAPKGDLQRLEAALLGQWNLEGLACDLAVLQALQPALRRGERRVTVAVHDGARIVAIWPGFHDRAFGIAFDVGSTTIAGHLCDLASGDVLASSGMMNPQIRMGEDLMSRVSYVMMNPGGERELTRVVRGALADLAADLAAQAGIDPLEVLEVTLVGNPIMHHLLLGIDPTELGGAPFALACDEAIELRAAEIGIATIHPGARAYLLPLIAGHVGADTAAVILSESPHLSDETVLIVDVGTNAELVLGDRSRLVAASSPTGPAFEGAQISAGQRAAPGAVERVRIDPSSLEPRFKVVGCEFWSDEPGFDSAVASTGVTGICGSGIIEAIAELFLAGVIAADGTIDGAKAARTARIRPEGRTFAYLLHHGPPELRVTQGDVRAIQLAKAALHAGARLLMDRLGIDGLDRITLAGAFGSHIDPLYALVLGLIPDCDPAKVTSAGNAAGTGARIALLNRESRREIERVVRLVDKVETAVEPAFQAHFVAAMAFPHKTDPYPRLRARIALPEARAATTVRDRRRRTLAEVPGRVD